MMHDEVERIMSMSDDEILTWTRAEGLDPEKVAEDGRACLERAIAQADAEGRIEPGRCYYEKRVGWHYEVWYCRSDSSIDEASGVSEWKASSVKYWRWINAARTASEMWRAFNDGVWIANVRQADIARRRPALSPHVRAAVEGDA